MSNKSIEHPMHDLDLRFHLRPMRFQILYVSILTLSGLAFLLNITATFQLKKTWNFNKVHSLYAGQILLVSLCCSNGLLGITSTVHSIVYMFTEIRLPHEVVHFINYFLRFTILASILHVTALTTDRLLYMKFPLKYRHHVSMFRVVVTAVSIWIVSLAPCLFPISHDEFLVTLAVLILLCDGFIVVSYTYILRVVFRTIELQERTFIEHDKKAERKIHHRERGAVFVCLLIVVSFLLFTLLPMVHVFIDHEHLNEMESYKEGGLLDYVMFALVLCKALCDPIVYILRSLLAKRTNHFRQNPEISRCESASV